MSASLKPGPPAPSSAISSACALTLIVFVRALEFAASRAAPRSASVRLMRYFFAGIPYKIHNFKKVPEVYLSFLV